MEGLKKIQSALESHRQQAFLAAPRLRLVAVSKQQPLQKIEAILAQGHRYFGENRVQEAEARWPSLKTRYPDARLHLIGPLQTNKAKQALALFDVIETLDRLRLAQALAEEMARSGRRLPCYVQINTGEEPQKSGILPSQADAFIRYCKETLHLPVEGLMCIPPVGDHPAPHFALLRQVAQRHGLPELSMGMSADWRTAVRMGATEIRIGRALFGER